MAFVNSYSLDDLFFDNNVRKIIDNHHFTLIEYDEILYSNYEDSDAKFHVDGYRLKKFSKNMELNIIKGSVLSERYKEILNKVQQNGDYLMSTIDYNGNIPIVMAAVQNKGMALRYASDKLKENKVVVLAAFKENSGAFYRQILN